MFSALLEQDDNYYSSDDDAMNNKNNSQQKPKELSSPDQQERVDPQNMPGNDLMNQPGNFANMIRTLSNPGQVSLMIIYYYRCPDCEGVAVRNQLCLP